MSQLPNENSNSLDAINLQNLSPLLLILSANLQSINFDLTQIAAIVVLYLR
jgi:hypothetical protein